VVLTTDQPIEHVLAGASLVVTWHSNVAVDAIRLGIPVICREGAAAAVCPSELGADDPRPLDPESNCPAARDYSRAYLHHLVRAGEILGMTLLTWANIAYYQDLMAGARAAIRAGRYADYMAETAEGWAKGDAEAAA
jgi:hypothetical protein